MALTKGDLRTLTRQLLGNRTSASITDAWYDARVYSAYRRLCTFQGEVKAPGMRQPALRRLGFFELQDRNTRTISSVTPTLTGNSGNFITPLPATNVVTVVDLFDRTNNRGLDRRSLRELRTRDPDKTGRPRTWCPAGQGGTVGYYVNQIPTTIDTAIDAIDVYEWVYLYPAALATDATVPVIPDTWHIAIVHAAASEGAMLLDMPEKHGEMEGKFIAYIAERKSPIEEAAHSGLAGARRFTPIGPRF